MKKTLTIFALAATLLPSVMAETEEIELTWSSGSRWSPGAGRNVTYFSTDAIQHPAANAKGVWFHSDWEIDFDLVVGAGSASTNFGSTGEYGTVILEMNRNANTGAVVGDSPSFPLTNQGFRIFLTESGNLYYRGTSADSQADHLIASGISNGSNVSVNLKHTSANSLTITTVVDNGAKSVTNLTTEFNWSSGNGDKTASLLYQMDTGLSYAMIGEGENGWGLKDLTLTADHSASGEGKLTVKVQDLVPEPATATLSLLALAGLAARRRRKH